MDTNRRTASTDGGTGRAKRRRVGVMTCGAVAGAVLATLFQAPVAGATGSVFAHITDPSFPDRQARVSDDGRLGVGGVVGTYPTVPLGAWHETEQLDALDIPRSTPDREATYAWRLVHMTPPDHAMAISSASLFVRFQNRYRFAALSALRAKPEHGCRFVPDLGARSGPERVVDLSMDMDNAATRNVVFPTPVVVPPSPTGTCLFLYVDSERPRDIGSNIVNVQGFDAPYPVAWAPPTPPGQDDEGKEDSPQP